MLVSSGATTNEMHDLELITFVELKLSPTVARGDLAVQFDCNAIRLHPQTLDEAGESNRSIELLDVPIDLDFHEPDYASTLRKRNLRVALRPA